MANTSQLKFDGIFLEIWKSLPSRFSVRARQTAEMPACGRRHPGARLAHYSAWESYKFLIFARRAADALRHLLATAGTFLPRVSREADIVGYMLDADEDVLNADGAQIN